MIINDKCILIQMYGVLGTTSLPFYKNGVKVIGQYARQLLNIGHVSGQEWIVINVDRSGQSSKWTGVDSH